MKPGTWGDHATLNALSLFWGVKMVVVQANGHSLREIRLHCNDDLALENADMVVLYNGSTHYSAVCELKCLRNIIRAIVYIIRAGIATFVLFSVKNEKDGRFLCCAPTGTGPGRFSWDDFAMDDDPDLSPLHKKRREVSNIGSFVSYTVHSCNNCLFFLGIDEG